jgi:tetratricopeptide (TPR) repeat protein
MKSYRELFADKEKVLEAIEYYNSLIEETGDDCSDYLAKRCFLYYVSKDYQKALDDVSHLLKHNPEDMNALCMRSLINGNLDNISGASDDLQKSKKIDSSGIFPHYVETALTFGSKDYEDAIEILFKIGEESLENPRTFLYRGLCRLMSGQYSKAVLDFKEAGESSPHWEILTKKMIAKAYLCGGIDQANLQKYAAAVLLFENLVTTDPEDANGHFFLGEAYMNLQEWEDAKSNFEKAVKLAKDPDIEQDARDMIEILDRLTIKN